MSLFDVVVCNPYYHVVPSGQIGPYWAYLLVFAAELDLVVAELAARPDSERPGVEIAAQCYQKTNLEEQESWERNHLPEMSAMEREERVEDSAAVVERKDGQDGDGLASCLGLGECLEQLEADGSLMVEIGKWAAEELGCLVDSLVELVLM